MYKVFYLSKEIIFTQSDREIVALSNDMVVNVSKLGMLGSAYQAYINDDEYARLIFICTNKFEIAFRKFISLFKNIEAAGGLVRNDKNELLMIYRLGKWDLPKGKIEGNESPAMAALREVNEETGVNSLEITQKLDSTYHIYYVNNRKFLKTTHWFEMQCKDKKMPVPQLVEGITMVEWLEKDGVRMAMKNTYDSLRDLLGSHLTR